MNNAARPAVWTVDLDALPECLVAQGEESERAARLADARNRRRWIAARWSLRQILSAHTGVPAESLVVSAGPLSKPRLEGFPVRFSVSHAGRLAVIAVSGVDDVGVDVEPIEDEPEPFLREWTAKEAYLKAIGLGLAAGVDTPLPRRGWTIANFSPMPGYVGAIAIPAEGAVWERRTLHAARPGNPSYATAR